MLGGPGEGAKADTHQSYPRVLPSLFELDPLGLHFRDEHYRYALEPSECTALVPSTHGSFPGVQFLEAPEFRNITLKCLAEIAALPVGPEYDAKFLVLFQMVMISINRMVPPSTGT